MSDQKRSHVTAGPAGLMVLAFYLGCLFAVLKGHASPELLVILVPLGLIGGVVQLCAGFFELQHGRSLPGNVMCAFSAFMFLGMGEQLLKVLKFLPANSSGVDGYVFTIMGLLMAGFTFAFLYKTLAAGLFMISTDVFFLCAGVSWLFGIHVLFTIAAWSLPVVIVTIIWQAVGEVLNSDMGETIIGLGKPLLTQSSTVSDIANEYGLGETNVKVS